MTRHLWKPIRTLHDWACRHEVLFALLSLVLLLRLPNLAEPYWYGDEAIYLTIGTALRHGAVLYRDIVDHKTPIIYFLAMVPGQFWFRILLIGWMLASTTWFYALAQKLYSWSWAVVSTLAFILFTSVPWMEGHIPNGELFVMGFVLAGLNLLLRTQALSEFLDTNTLKFTTLNRRELSLWFAGASFLSLGLLTKVPALLDVGGVLSFLWFMALASDRRGRVVAHLWRATRWFVSHIFIAGVFVVLPLLLSLGYFALRGALSDYIQFGLLYNLHYTSNWGLPFTQPWLVALFSLPGKVAVLLVVFFFASVLAWWKPKERVSAWLYFWTAAALFGSLLSNRPYPHYLQQVMLPLCLFVPMLFQVPRVWLTRVFVLDKVATVVAVTLLLGFGFYSTNTYYSRYVRMALGQISPAEYRHGFDRLVAQNEALVPTIQGGTNTSEALFVWGTNPMLYAQTQRHPATRFTVAFHIHDLKVYEQTLKEVQAKQPPFIVVMKAESPLPGLQEYLDAHYWITEETSDMLLYRRTKLAETSLLQ